MKLSGKSLRASLKSSLWRKEGRLWIISPSQLQLFGYSTRFFMKLWCYHLSWLNDFMINNSSPSCCSEALHLQVTTLYRTDFSGRRELYQQGKCIRLADEVSCKLAFFILAMTKVPLTDWAVHLISSLGDYISSYAIRMYLCVIVLTSLGSDDVAAAI